MSAIASPGEEIELSVPLLSSPCPHSWSKTAEISPVLPQPPPSRKKLTEEPSQNALHVSTMFMLAVSWEFSHDCAVASSGKRSRHPWICRFSS